MITALSRLLKGNYKKPKKHRHHNVSKTSVSSKPQVEVSKLFTLHRKFSKPETLILPRALKASAHRRRLIQNPVKTLANYNLAKLRNKVLTNIQKRVKIIPFVRSDSPRENQRKIICRLRKARRSEIMKKTRGRGIRVKKASWSPTSLIKCKRK